MIVVASTKCYGNMECEQGIASKTRIGESTSRSISIGRKKDNSKILDELVAITGHYRKHALRMLAVPKERAASICLLRYAAQANASLLSIKRFR